MQDMFEKVNKAYEFISSREGRDVDGPNPENIVLILRAQSILYRRFSDSLCEGGRVFPCQPYSPDHLVPRPN